MQREVSAVSIPFLSFKTCPQCLGSALSRLGDIHVICSLCRWDSIESFVDSGNLDALIYQFEIMDETDRLMKALERDRQTRRSALG